jgi:hypothetical protein
MKRFGSAFAFVDEYVKLAGKSCCHGQTQRLRKTMARDADESCSTDAREFDPQSTAAKAGRMSVGDVRDGDEPRPVVAGLRVEDPDQT